MDHIFLDKDTHTQSFPPNTVITITKPNDIEFFSMASHAIITRAILPSGLKMPSAPENCGWIVTSPSIATLLSLN